MQPVTEKFLRRKIRVQFSKSFEAVRHSGSGRTGPYFEQTPLMHVTASRRVAVCATVASLEAPALAVGLTSYHVVSQSGTLFAVPKPLCE